MPQHRKGQHVSPNLLVSVSGCPERGHSNPAGHRHPRWLTSCLTSFQEEGLPPQKYRALQRCPQKEQEEASSRGPGPGGRWSARLHTGEPVLEPNSTPLGSTVCGTNCF